MERLFIIGFLSLVFDVAGQCYVSRYRAYTQDSCNRMNVYHRHNKAMKMISNTKNIYTLTIFNRSKPLQLPDALMNMELYGIYMGVCTNDSIFFKLKHLGGLSYSTDSLNRELVSSMQLAVLTINFKYGSINGLIKDSINIYKRLSLISNNESKLDSSFLFFKQLKHISMCFNPFSEDNFLIYSNLRKLEGIGIYNMDFRKFEITSESLDRLSKYRLTFIDCKLTKVQKKLLITYKNVNL